MDSAGPPEWHRARPADTSPDGRPDVVLATDRVTVPGRVPHLRTGSILVNSVVDGPDFLAGVGARQTTLALGAFLMIATAAVDIGKAVFFFPVLERHGKRTAVAYLATMVFEMAMMTVGVLALLMLIPLAGAADQLGQDTAQALGSLAVDANETAYQIGQLSLAFGCLFLCALLLRSRLVPRWLAGWGLIGYVLHMAGAAAEIFGAPISLVLLIPGGIFEVTLGIWLLVTGFTPAAYDGAPVTKAEK